MQVTVGFENNMIIQMHTTKLSLLCLLAVTVLSFPRNCQVYSPNSFDQCAVCMRNYYLVNFGCAPCPTTRNSIKGCGSPVNETVDVNNAVNGTAGNGTNSANSTSGNSSANGNVSTINGSINGNTNVSTNSSINGTTQGSNNGQINGSINGIANGNNVTVNSTSNSSNIKQTNSSSSSKIINQSSTPSTNPNPNKDSSSQSPTSASISDLTQIIFKLLPPKCCDFTVTPTLTCRGCEKGYYLTADNTCELTPPSAPSVSTPTATLPSNNISSSSPNKTIPVELKVSNSLPSASGAVPITGTSLPIVVTQSIPSSTPQPIFVPVSSLPTTPTTSTPTPTLTSASTPSSSTPSSSRPACPPNLSFDPTLPVLGQNCPCLCFQRFFYDFIQQQCLPVNPLCKTVGCQNECLTCYIGYVLINGKCVVNNGQSKILSTSGAVSLDSNCQTFQQSSYMCAVCNKGYHYNDRQGVCMPNAANCRNYDTSTSLCTSCNPGFILVPNDKTCQALPSSSSLSSALLDSSKCLKKVGGRCTACAYRYFLSNGLCLQVSDQCLTFHSTFGYCTSCYGGYQLNDGVCQQSLPNCAVPAPSGCVTCNPGYYSNGGDCTPVSLLCNGYDPSTGYCLDCIFPYSLDTSTGACFYSP